jgi:hypothetical protein
MIVPYGLRFCFDCVLGSLFLRSSAVIRSAIFGGLVLGFSELMDAAHRALEQASSRNFPVLDDFYRHVPVEEGRVSTMQLLSTSIWSSFSSRLPHLISPRRFETVG